MTDDFFNTIGLTGETLRIAQKDASNQQRLILAWFGLQRPDTLASPSQIYRLAMPAHVPLTSVRRAITNLTNDRKLVKTERQVEGIYGKPEHCWRLPRGPRQASLFGEENAHRN